MPPKRPPLTEYHSLAEISEIYNELFVVPGPITSDCGCVVHCYEHHFVHMVKLVDGSGGRLYFPDEKQKIVATTIGLGGYQLDAIRARNLRSALETLKCPDKVVRASILNSADRVFIKEFESKPYAFTAVLVGMEDGVKKLYTSHPVRARQIKKYLEGEILWSKTPQPLSDCQVAV